MWPFHDAPGISWYPRTPCAKEMATVVKPRRPVGQAFYTTALVVTLFAIFSVLKDVGHNKEVVREASRLALRSLEKQDEEVRLQDGRSSERY